MALLHEWLGSHALSDEQQSMVRGTLSALQRDATIQQLIADQLTNESLTDQNRLLLLEVVGRTSPESWPELWNEPLEQLLSSQANPIALATIAAIQGTELTAFARALRSLAQDDARPIALRRAAIVTLAQSADAIEPAEFELLISGLEATIDPLERLSTAEGLARARLTEQQLFELADAMSTAGPIELPLLLQAFRRGGDSRLGEALLAALTAAPGKAALEPLAVASVFDTFPSQVVQQATNFVANLSHRETEDIERFETLAQRLDAGDVRRGEAVFFGSRAACSACHRVKGQGGTIGPDLSAIGQVRSERDLLEAIVLPSQTLARGYESWSVTTRDGHAYVGVITSEGPTAIALRTTDRHEIRLERAEIDELLPSRLSIMPQGLEQVLSSDELNHLIAFLRAQR